MKILLIDNYDSFTYNLYQYLKHFVSDVVVFENDKITIAEIEKKQPDKIVISPGPGNPKEAGISLEVVTHFWKSKPILGVCLGHQIIAQAFGGKIIPAKTPMHGKSKKIVHNGKGIYSGLLQNNKVGLYHSLIVDEESLNENLIVTAKSQTGVIMGISHKQFPITGVQFHPESILTKNGYDMINNWIFQI